MKRFFIIICLVTGLFITGFGDNYADVIEDEMEEESKEYATKKLFSLLSSYEVLLPSEAFSFACAFCESRLPMTSNLFLYSLWKPAPLSYFAQEVISTHELKSSDFLEKPADISGSEIILKGLLSSMFEDQFIACISNKLNEEKDTSFVYEMKKTDLHYALQHVRVSISKEETACYKVVIEDTYDFTVIRPLKDGILESGLTNLGYFLQKNTIVKPYEFKVCLYIKTNEI